MIGPEEITLDGLAADARRQQLSIPDLVAEALRRAIVMGILKQGEPLPQDEIAGRFGTSKIPVREALRRLEAEGFVTISPRRGASVAQISSKDVVEAFELRSVLEPMLLEKAIPHLEHENIAAAAATLEALDREENITRWGRLNWQFHAALYQPADRPRTLAFLENLHSHIDRFVRMHMDLVARKEASRSEHEAILEACAKRHATQARTLLIAHIAGVGDLIQNQREAYIDRSVSS